MIITLIICSILLLLLSIFFSYKYFAISKKVKSLYDIGTGRKGFYYYKYGYSGQAIVYIDELDRYTNGYSKISISDVELVCGGESVCIEAKKNFLTLKMTNTIDWLEGENHIKEIRREKLNNIKKIGKLF